KQPVGVVVAITPWNYPIALMSWKLGPGLGAGCSMIVKPPSATPLAPYAFVRALNDGGMPPGVLNLLTGSGKSLAEAFVEDSRVAKIAMTGSTNTGKQLMKMFGPRLIRISLELGGQCPAIICEDADLEKTAALITYKAFRNMGQSCSSVNRIYIHESVKDAFVAKLKTRAESLRIGDAYTDGTEDVGPMTTAEQRAVVEEHVRDAIARGGRVIYGGQRPQGEQFAKGNFYLPTILNNVTHDMKIMREETFGPVAPIMTFSSLKEAVGYANDTTYGLAAYVFTENLSNTVYVSEALEAGTVCVNNVSVNTVYAPYEGWKESGFGFELSPRAIEEYLHQKHIKIALDEEDACC
ncbi:MAG: aldehyde dehydrogenase family protein, partial [Phycisphaerales bacterium]